MGQVTIYLDQETEARLKAEAQAAGISVSRWLAELIQEKAATDWPPSIRALAGAWEDFPEPDELRNVQADDIVQESI